LLLLLLPMLASTTGCPRKITPAPAPALPSEAETPDEAPDQDLPPPETEPPEAEPAPCADGGRLWDGKPEDCSYEHGGCCYDSAASACAAAGCAADRCNVMESYPAQIACGD
jgi:hypothetical protein